VVIPHRDLPEVDTHHKDPREVVTLNKAATLVDHLSRQHLQLKVVIHRIVAILSLAVTCLTRLPVVIQLILRISKDIIHNVATLNKEHPQWEVVIPHQEDNLTVATTLMAVDMAHRPPHTLRTPEADFLHHTHHLEVMEDPWEDTVAIVEITMGITRHTKLTSSTDIDEAPRHLHHLLAPLTTAGDILTSTSVND